MVVEIVYNGIGMKKSKICITPSNAKEVKKYHGIKNYFGIHEIDTVKLTIPYWKEDVILTIEKYADEWFKRRDEALKGIKL